MEQEKNKIKIPPFGWRKEIAKLAGCSVVTVCNAIRHNARGVKAEKVRRLYRKKYGGS
jgi:hypothetical protein